jgi:hypothetical protein
MGGDTYGILAAGILRVVFCDPQFGRLMQRYEAKHDEKDLEAAKKRRIVVIERELAKLHVTQQAAVRSIVLR